MRGFLVGIVLGAILGGGIAWWWFSPGPLPDEAANLEREVQRLMEEKKKADIAYFDLEKRFADERNRYHLEVERLNGEVSRLQEEVRLYADAALASEKLEPPIPPAAVSDEHLVEKLAELYNVAGSGKLLPTPRDVLEAALDCAFRIESLEAANQDWKGALELSRQEADKLKEIIELKDREITSLYAQIPALEARLDISNRLAETQARKAEYWEAKADSAERRAKLWKFATAATAVAAAALLLAH